MIGVTKNNLRGNNGIITVSPSIPVFCDISMKIYVKLLDGISFEIPWEKKIRRRFQKTNQHKNFSLFCPQGFRIFSRFVSFFFTLKNHSQVVGVLEVNLIELGKNKSSSKEWSFSMISWKKESEESFCLLYGNLVFCIHKGRIADWICLDTWKFVYNSQAIRLMQHLTRSSALRTFSWSFCR